MIRALRSHVRDAAAGILRAIGETDPARRLRGGLPILTFHRVLPKAVRDAYTLPGLAVTPEELEWFLRFFGRSFECAPLRDAFRRWSDEPDAVRPALAITFDDGQLDNWSHARPVLERLGMKASFFVPVDAVEDGRPLWHDRIARAVEQALAVNRLEAEELAAELAPQDGDRSVDPHRMVVLAKSLESAERMKWVERWEDVAGEPKPADWDGFMDWDQLRSLVRAGHEVGSHSMSHEILPLCDAPQLEHEIGESRRVLESRLDVPIESFCYPNGDCDVKSVAAVRDSGYRLAVTTAWGSNRPGADRYRLRRFDMRADHSVDARGRLSEARVAWRISGLHPGLRG